MSLSAAKCCVSSAFGLLLSFPGITPAWAAYNLLLKDGRVIEAQSKPILREGYYQFAGSDHKFQSLPADLVDETATATANDSPKTVRKGKVFTNEDLDSKAPEPAPVPAPEPKKSETKTKTDEAAKSAKNNEAYWRGEVRKLRQRMAPLDLEIEKVKNEIKAGGTGGFDLSSGLQRNKMYIVDRDSELKSLEKQRGALQEQLELLEEKGRKAGALPGWFR